MPHKGKDDVLENRVRMLHTRDGARDALGYARGRVLDDLDSDTLLLRGSAHCSQDIGEAASKVTEEGRANCEELPWRKILGMRHILVHVYYDIDADVVWRVVNRELETMLSSLDRHLDRAQPGRTESTCPHTA